MKKKASRLRKFGRTIHTKIGLFLVKCLLEKFKETGSMDRIHCSGRPRTVSTEENIDLIKDLVSSQEEQPHIHLAPRKIAEQTRISRSSIQRVLKIRNLKQFKHLKTPQMSQGTRNRTETRVGSL